MTTAEILAACRKGDARAEDTLFHQYFSRLIGLVRRRLSRPLARRIDPEDVVLSAYRSFFVGLKNEARFTATETPEDLWALLATITRRKIAKQERRHRARRRSVRQEISTEDFHDPISPGNSVDAAAILTEEIEQLLGSLDDSDRDLLARWLEGASSAEIARERNCSERTIRRARERIERAIAFRQKSVSRTPERLEISDLDPAHPPKPAPTHRETDILLRRLAGEGAFAKVYEGTDRQSGETVAVKFLRKERWKDLRAVRALLREHEILRTLDHPHIIRVRGWGTTRAGATFLVLDWVDGEALEQSKTDRLPLKDILSIAAKIATALLAAHDRGVIHGDLSPANILRGRDGRILLSDFGFARWSGSPTLTEIGGTPGFLAPEVRAATFPTTSIQTDVYGFSALLFTLLTGQRRPSEEKPTDKILAALTEAAASTHGESLPQDILSLVALGLTRQPADRPVGLAPYLALLPQNIGERTNP